MGKSIKPEMLGKAIEEELGLYHESVIEKVNAAGEKAIKKLLKLARASAPVKSGGLKKSLTTTDVTKRGGDKEFTFGAKAPKYRILHLVAHGHAGNGHKGNPFLANALETVLPEYEKEVEEAIKND